MRLTIVSLPTARTLRGSAIDAGDTPGLAALDPGLRDAASPTRISACGMGNQRDLISWRRARYLPMMSNSRLTRVPGTMRQKLVWSKV